MSRSLILSVLLAAAATLWVLSGSLTESGLESPDAGTEKNHAATPSLFKVKAEHQSAQTMQDQIELQGAIEAERTIDIRAETEGTIERIYTQQGQRLKAGDLILSLAMNDRQARLEQARAQLKLKKAELASSQSLKQKNMISDNQHQQRIADVAAAEAAIKVIEVEIKQTQIQAAFNGLLNAVHVEEGDYVSQGAALATLVDESRVIITTEVPQQHIAKLRLGQLVEATLLDGRKISGRLSYMSGAANATTRTFKIEARADNHQGVEHFGQSAQVRLYLGERQAYHLPASLLNLDREGNLQIKTLDSQLRVVSHQVEIIRSDNEGLWLSGLPDAIHLITVGQGFVADGEQVALVDTQISEEASGKMQ
jgi:multidrug efflux system membrane fusion protein